MIFFDNVEHKETHRQVKRYTWNERKTKKRAQSKYRNLVRILINLDINKNKFGEVIGKLTCDRAEAIVG